MASNPPGTAISSTRDEVTPHKKGRTFGRPRRPSTTMLISPDPSEDFQSRPRRHLAAEDEHEVEAIAILADSRAAGENVAPYLQKYVPRTYNPVGGQISKSSMTSKANTKYCNRHRPDIKCRRQADEPTMEQLQNELATLSNSDQQGISHMWSLFSAAPPRQRNLMLQGILNVCCYPQLSFIASSVRDLIKLDFISLLPTELAFKIFSYLDTTSLCKAAQVSRRWRTLADDDVVWHRMCEQHIARKCTKCGWGLPLLDRKRLRSEKRQIQLRASGRSHNESEVGPSLRPTSHDASASPQPSSTKRPRDDDILFEQSAKKRCIDPSQSDESSPQKKPWKDVYKARFRVGTNWKHGRCTVKILKGHQNGVMCLQFSGSTLATGSYDTTIKIWDLESGEELRTLKGHTSGVRCLQFDDVRLISGSLDNTIRMWDWQTGQCFRVFEPQMGGIISLNFGPKYLCCGSMDGSLRVWNTCEKVTFSLRGHTDFVNAVKVDSASRTVFSSSDDCTVRLWDLDARRCLRTFEGHVGQVQQVLPLPPEFEFDEDDFKVNADNDTDTDCEDAGSNYQAGQEPYNHLHANGQRSCSSHPYHCARSSSPLTNPPLFPDDPDRPNPPQYMLTGALDSTIRLWHVPSGRCLRTFFGHLEGIWALAADTLRVVSGAEDRMVKIWDPRTGHCERTFAGHRGAVTCVGLSGERLVSGGEDCEIRVLEFGGNRDEERTDG